MGIIEVIKNGFRITNKILGLVAVYSVFYFLVSGVSERLINPGTVRFPDTQAIFSILLFTITVWVGGNFLWAGSCSLIKEYIRTHQFNLKELPERSLKYFPRVFGFGLLALTVTALAIGSIVLVITAMVILKNPLVIITFLLLSAAVAIISAYLYTVLSLSPYAIVCDELGIIEAIRTAYRLFNKLFWKIVLLSICVGFILASAGMLLGMWEKIFESLVGRDAASVITWLATSTLQGYAGIWTIATFISFYYLASRKEKTA